MKFSGKVGFGESVEATPGKWVDHILERSYYGDVIRNSRALQDSDRVVPGVSLQHSISILADGFIEANVLSIRYVEWQGIRWKVPDVEIQRPRLILQVGEVYDGPVPTS